MWAATSKSIFALITGYFGSDFTHSSSEDEEMDIPILEQFQRQHLEVFPVNLTKIQIFWWNIIHKKVWSHHITFISPWIYKKKKTENK